MGEGRAGGAPRVCRAVRTLCVALTVATCHGTSVKPAERTASGVSPGVNHGLWATPRHCSFSNSHEGPSGGAAGGGGQEGFGHSLYLALKFAVSPNLLLKK